MDRRRFIGFALLVAASERVAAQRNTQQAKLWRVGYLSLARIDMDKSWVDSFREGLRDLGYVEGQNLFIEQRQPRVSPN